MGISTTPLDLTSVTVKVKVVIDFKGLYLVKDQSLITNHILLPNIYMRRPSAALDTTLSDHQRSRLLIL